ncbi:actin-related protein 7 [Trichomonascus vanleenenianus]|uniref:actin-related protein 7 n=1 Tax=Trichomonascus vanleenenianus TaxID=2268995 RepID=UPI003ECAD484
MTNQSSDDITSVVIDAGSMWTRVGFSGDHAPSHVIPTAYGKLGDTYLFDDDGVNTPEPGKEIFSPLSDGCIQDWSAIAKQWRYIYDEKLAMDPSELPLVTTEQPWNPKENRVRVLETVFEDLEVPLFSLLKAPLCAAYESARPTALVIDIGSSVASVTPVVDGNIISKASYHTRYAGDFINLHIYSHLRSREVEIVPQYRIKHKAIAEPGQPATPEFNEFQGITESYHNYQVQRVLTDFKESTSQIAEHPFSASQQPPVIGSRPFEFPSGYNLSFGAERLTTAEPLFQPTQYPLPGVVIPEGSPTQGIGELIYLSLQQAPQHVNSSITSLPPADVTPTLLYNVVITGGTTLLQGLTQRIENEMVSWVPNFRPRYYLSPDRKSTVWLGASILASTGTYESSSNSAPWISKAEYEELGAENAAKRFK